jgi:hypothetical protein
MNNWQTKKIDLSKIRTELSKYYSELDIIEKTMTSISGKEERIELMKLWKSRLGKYWKVGLFHTDNVEYVFLKEMHKDKMVFEMGFSEGKFKTFFNYDMIITNFGSSWTEITKTEFEEAIKDYEVIKNE